jgi:peptidoglycan/LPS O-acetylase OafA/YrhL
MKIKNTGRFTTLHGMRAWLAWLVVASHIAQQSPLREGSATLETLYHAGYWAVQTFIILSGFVITHLIIERAEPYRPYIVRRFMRLFPTFALCCLLSGLTYYFSAQYGRPDWFARNNGPLYDSQVAHLPMHIAAHLTMLHGAIPNNILYGSQYVFLGPAWSVSLEWQFYLLAPLILLSLKNGARAALLVALVILGKLAYHFLLGTQFGQPSIIIAQMPLFLLGIVSRLALPRLLELVAYPAATNVALFVTAIALGTPATGFWLVGFGSLLQSSTAPAGIDAWYRRMMHKGLESRIIQFLADRSYTTYLVHGPIWLAIETMATRNGDLDGLQMTLILLLIIPATLILQEPIHQFIEKPGNHLGKRWADRLMRGNSVSRP